MAEIRHEWIENYVCSELETVRKMRETHDYSQLMAIVERIQIHVNAMEAALYTRRDTVLDVNKIARDETKSKSVRLAEIVERTKAKE